MNLFRKYKETYGEVSSRCKDRQDRVAKHPNLPYLSLIGKFSFILNYLKNLQCSPHRHTGSIRHCHHHQALNNLILIWETKIASKGW